MNELDRQLATAVKNLSALDEKSGTKCSFYGNKPNR